MREITEIIIHCADTPDGRYFAAADIDQWHKQRGWRCIGYHKVVLLNGLVEDGRPLEEEGAHCHGRNGHSVGVCLIGRSKYTTNQWAALQDLVAQLRAAHPQATVHGHNQFDASKTCPGFSVADWLANGTRPLPGHVLEMSSDE